jgi:hypothetical protein
MDLSDSRPDDRPDSQRDSEDARWMTFAELAGGSAGSRRRRSSDDMARDVSVTIGGMSLPLCP